MTDVVSELAVNAKTNNIYILPLWQAVEKLICKWAGQYFRYSKTPRFDVDDLRQAGYLALVDAVNGYDPSAGMKFATYLNFHIRKHFAEVSGNRGSKRRPEVYASSLDEPLTDESDTSRLDTIADTESEGEFNNVVELIYNRQLRAALDECLTSIPQPQADVLRTLYYKGQTRTETAVELNSNISAIRHTEYRALQAMRRGANYTRLKEYRDNIISRTMYRSGFTAFRDSGYSSVEWAVEKLSELK